jgi:hypothetical protein
VTAVAFEVQAHAVKLKHRLDDSAWQSVVRDSLKAALDGGVELERQALWLQRVDLFLKSRKAPPDARVLSLCRRCVPLPCRWRLMGGCGCHVCCAGAVAAVAAPVRRAAAALHGCCQPSRRVREFGRCTALGAAVALHSHSKPVCRVQSAPHALTVCLCVCVCVLACAHLPVCPCPCPCPCVGIGLVATV